MDNGKSPGNDGITKEIYIKFSGVVKKPLCASIQRSFIAGELMMMVMMMMMMMNFFCGMIDRRKAFNLISSRDHCQ